MRPLKVISLLLLLALSGFVKAQVTSFSMDPAVFINELESFLNSANDKQLSEDMKVFKQNWNLGKFSPIQQKSVINICNDMLLEKMTVQPYFGYMLKSIAAFLENKLPDKTLLQWQKVTESLIGESNADYLDFLQMTSRLFGSNTLLQDDAKKWYADNNNYDILYEKGKIVVRFQALTLTCQGPLDRMVISQTSGTYIPSEKVWIGNNGKTNFDRVMKGQNVEVTFKKYKLNLEQANYKIDSAELSFSKYFTDKIKGNFEDRLSFATDSASVLKSDFPKFKSFANTLEIKGIVGPNATFKGGFAVTGKEINTQTSNGQETEISIYYKNKKKVTLRSKAFKISDGVAVSPEAFFVMYLDSGNIYHPRATVNFIFKENKLVVNRGEKGLMRVPFTDEFHKVDLDVQQIRWKIDEAFVDFDNINNDQEAKIASQDFFREIIYARIQGALQFNPLEAVMAYYAKMLRPTRRMKFAVKDYAAYMKTQSEYLVTTFIDMHDGGFVNYFQEQDSVQILPKLFNYVIAHQGHRDYDVIRFSSLIAKRSNATLNLESNELSVEGVLKFFFSDSQNVIVVPTDQHIILKKNRRVAFGGTIRAGRFDFYGKKFEFDYNNFRIDYSNIDSMRLYFPDSTGKKVLPIKSVLRNIYGTLYIDKPTNKSGIINYPEYPIFQSSKGSEVLYDKPHIHNGAYKSDKFKFEVDPFTIDSLDNFTIAGLQFDGTFYSDGIFPDFRHKVSIQKDYSLGFIKPTPPGGYPMYRGKGHGEMVMSLSEEGFYGLTGEIDYSGSKTKFQRVLLLPDKAVGNADSYEIPHGATYPQVSATNVPMEWNPYEDKFKITQGSSPIKVFKMGYDFYGSITQTPSKLIGDGTLAWEQARFQSQDMTLGPMKASANKAALKIFAADSTKIAFETNNIKGNMDFSTRLGTFTTNEVGALTKFPFNSYVTNLNDYKWNMDLKTIEAKIGPAMAGQTPYFLSTNPSQDSLKFEGKSALYSLNDYTLKVSQIPYIDIADSRVFLKDGKVTIRENARMDMVDSAKIIANRIDKYHDIYRVSTKIYGKNKMHGFGKYQYVNRDGKRQEFTLDSIIVNRDKHIEAWGLIGDTSGFTLDTKIGYKGYAQVLSTEKFIQFKGYVKPLHTFKNILPSAWIRFNDRVDPKNVIVNMMDPRDKDNKKQYVGLFMANDSSHIYPLFYSWKRRYSDPDVTNDTGVLYYDHDKNSFFAGNKDILLNGALKGSYMQLNESNHTIHAVGPLDFGLETNRVKFKNAGTADLLEKDSSFTFNLAMMLDFPMHKDVVAKIKEKLGPPGSVNLNNDFFKKAVGEMVEDDKTARTIIKNIEKTGQIAGKDEAEYKVILSDATFRWDSKLKGMYCNDQVALASFAGQAVNKNIEVTMLMEHKRSGENMYMYLEFANNDWLFINLQKNVAYMFSSDPKLNEIITATMDKIGMDDFSIRMATQRQVDRFLGKFE